MYVSCSGWKCNKSCSAFGADVIVVSRAELAGRRWCSWRAGGGGACGDAAVRRCACRVCRRLGAALGGALLCIGLFRDRLFRAATRKLVAAELLPPVIKPARRDEQTGALVAHASQVKRAPPALAANTLSALKRAPVARRVFASKANCVRAPLLSAPLCERRASSSPLRHRPKAGGWAALPACSFARAARALADLRAAHKLISSPVLRSCDKNQRAPPWPPRTSALTQHPCCWLAVTSLLRRRQRRR